MKLIGGDVAVITVDMAEYRRLQEFEKKIRDLMSNCGCVDRGIPMMGHYGDCQIAKDKLAALHQQQIESAQAMSPERNGDSGGEK
jgi:hypothetical protein